MLKVRLELKKHAPFTAFGTFTGIVIMAALSDERDQQWARVGRAEFLTPAEKRAILGLPPLPEAP